MTSFSFSLAEYTNVVYDVWHLCHSFLVGKAMNGNVTSCVCCTYNVAQEAIQLESKMHPCSVYLDQSPLEWGMQHNTSSSLCLAS